MLLLPVLANLTTSGLYYKNIATINETSRAVRMMILSDTPSCGVTYDHHSDNSRGVIYTLRELLKYRHHT
jgi:hypothetical protein